MHFIQAEIGDIVNIYAKLANLKIRDIAFTEIL
jgi:hypothetical protein